MFNLMTDTKTVTTAQHSLEIKAPALIEMLNNQLAARMSDDGKRIPADAKVVVWVPGGGDWSSTDLDLRETPICVTWTERTEA